MGPGIFLPFLQPLCLEPRGLDRLLGREFLVFVLVQSHAGSTGQVAQTRATSYHSTHGAAPSHITDKYTSPSSGLRDLGDDQANHVTLRSESEKQQVDLWREVAQV